MAGRPVLPIRSATLKAPGATFRLGLLVVGAALAAAGAATDLWFLLVPGCIMIGWAIQPDADRFYLEGFGDGLDTGTRLMAEAAGDGAGMEGGGARDRADEPGRGDEAARTRQWAAVAATPIPRDERADGFGVGTRPARPATDERGEAIPLAGPRPSLLPDLSETVARGTRSLDLRPPGGPADGREDGAGLGPHRDGTS